MSVFKKQTVCLLGGINWTLDIFQIKIMLYRTALVEMKGMPSISD